MSKIEVGHEILGLHDDRHDVQALMKNPSVPRVWLSIISAFLIVASVAFALRAIGTWAENYIVFSNAQAADEIKVAPHQGTNYLLEQVSQGYLSQ
ncbi:MAG: hypothetical protein COT81_05440 [Candidatus Buchananbacteria bacterium CG10_big_fil_rev_8_21_14_0_10_42_9]|uniref:Uncharacterized protein n=1 Tax=Candidatus Buchananbacteria bacterium CG10_big_fil_rev_8_21_14_0_10_42_9 TaxID=1974526 RepID=A0A2H0VZW4_9BACT|nr:MAG: hypothetical protein COT81_05440 [Candidatus Buchananbacteria bacterium CG10_big_fil_rev_8_21_14_0_10_42_9]